MGAQVGRDRSPRGRELAIRVRRPGGRGPRGPRDTGVHGGRSTPAPGVPGVDVRVRLGTDRRVRRSDHPRGPGREDAPDVDHERARDGGGPRCVRGRGAELRRLPPAHRRGTSREDRAMTNRAASRTDPNEEMMVMTGLTIDAHLAAELLVEGEQMPVFVWTIDHPAGLVLVDTGRIDSRPEVEDMSPTPHPENIPLDVVCVINTHLHYDHCGGNRLFPGVPIHVQARELADARSLENYTFREWVDFDGATYVEHEGEAEVLPGIRLLPAPGHTDGHQVVVVETDAGTNVLGGDVAVWFGEFDGDPTEGQRRVLELGAPTWLSHAPGPEIPEHRA